MPLPARPARSRTWAILAASLCLLAALAATGLHFLSRPGQLVAHQIPLTSDNNQVLKLEQLADDHYWVIFFGYSRCPDICPLTLARLSQAYDRLPPSQQQRLQVLMVNVDPHVEQAQELVDYVALFHPDFKAAVASQDLIDPLVAHFEAFYRVTELPGSGLGYVVDHSPALYISTNQGQRLQTLVSDQIDYLYSALDQLTRTH